MKRIAVFGSYSPSCAGDMAILAGLANACRQIHGPKVSLEVLTAGPLNLDAELAHLGVSLPCTETRAIRWSLSGRAKERLGRWLGLQGAPAAPLAHHDVEQTLRSVDALLIGGGNLLMDCYPFWPHLLSRVCRIARHLNVPYAFVGVGAGPINHGISRSLLGECLRDARAIWFRDRHSLALCQGLLSMPQAVVAPDLAFGLKDRCPPRDPHGHGAVMAVNVAGVFGPAWPERDCVRYRAYLRAMVNLTMAIAEARNVEEIVVCDSNRAADRQASDSFVERLRDAGIGIGITAIAKPLTVRETIDQFRRADMAIVTRLHAGILAHLAGCRLIAVSYQPKISHVMREHGMTGAFVDVNDLIGHRVTDADVPDLLARSSDRESLVGTDEVTSRLASCFRSLGPDYRRQ